MRRSGEARRLMAAFVCLAALAGCGGSDEVADPTPAPTTAIESATATPAPAPTAAATATVAPAPTAAPAPTEAPAEPTEEAAILAAWERYLDLSIQARGKDPSPESLDFDSYTVDDGGEGIRNAMEGPNYAVGTVTSTDMTYFINAAGDARLDDCLDVQLEFRSREDDSFVSDELLLAPAEARLELTATGWRVAAFQGGSGETCGN